MPLPRLLLLTLLTTTASATTLAGPQGLIRIETSNPGTPSVETISIKIGNAWVPALSATGSAMRIITPTGPQTCILTTATPIDRGLLLSGKCGTLGDYSQRILLTDQPDVLDVFTQLALGPKSIVTSVEDRYDFLPAKHSTHSPTESPLDFVWSQNIKKELADVVANNEFKSPAIMFQQGEVFAALTPHLSDRLVAPLALDLDVTSDAHPWLSFGAVPSEPHAHSYFHRVTNAQPRIVNAKIFYAYSITASRQPPNLGYRRVVRSLWSEYGHPALLASPDAQLQVAVHSEHLTSFDSWRDEAWHAYANRVYLTVDCGEGKHCGTLSSFHFHTDPSPVRVPDALFNPWFESLRSAYGWYIYGRNTHDAEIMAKADSVLTLALSAPQNHGVFPGVYLVNDRKWLPGDYFAGYPDDYSTFAMSWTAYWMLQWATDLEPQRKAEVLRYIEPYAAFLLAQQAISGVIPSWFHDSPLRQSLEPRSEFRDFNAETGASALFLATLGSATGDAKYTQAAERAMDFITTEVVPRQRWFDFETYLSCAKKPYDFYDPWTAQYPQNNLAETQTVQAWLTLWKSTHKAIYLERGTNALDYLLLTQQVMNTPLFTPKLIGGFTTQNTDAEWSDARESHVATLLLDYFNATGNFEYLERSVAAARSGLAVAPWENWAHQGFGDSVGAQSGFHWGTGSAMTSIEIMSPMLGDAWIDLKSAKGIGFDESSLTALHIDGDQIYFQFDSPDHLRTFNLRFANADPTRSYHINWNDKPTQTVSGKDLLANGLRIGPL